MNCDLCNLLESGKGPNLETVEGMIKYNLTVCPDCHNWLNRIFSIRTRFLQTYGKVAEELKDY